VLTDGGTISVALENLPVSLRKPPLVEIWMSFRFEPAVDAPPWTSERYKVFLDSVAEQYPNVEQMVRPAIRVAATRPGKQLQTKEIRGQVRAWGAIREDGRRVVQLAPDERVVNSLRGESEPYRGSPSRLEEALAHYRRYLDCYHPAGVV